MSSGHHRCLGFRQMFLDRDDLPASTPLDRSRAIILIVQKILKRTQQERTQPALLLISAGQSVLLKQMSEKTLNKILGVSG
jgi:hypothetical protein